MFKKEFLTKGIIIVLGLVLIGIIASISWTIEKKIEKQEEKSKEEVSIEQKEETKGKRVPIKQEETYVMREIIFIPWGEGKEKLGLKEVEYMVQGIETVTARYGATKLEVDKDGSLYIWDDVAGEWYYDFRIIKKPKSNKILKYIKEKKKGKEREDYRHSSSIPLEEKVKVITKKKELKGQIVEDTIFQREYIDKTKGKPFKVEEFKNDYQYETKYEKRDIMTIKIKDLSDKLVGKVDVDYSTVPLGFDKEGNLYLLKDTTFIKVANPDNWQLETYKYSKKGNFLVKIDLLDDDLSWTNRLGGQEPRIKIDKEGNIYQLLPKSNGVYIYKWELGR